MNNKANINIHNRPYYKIDVEEILITQFMLVLLPFSQLLFYILWLGNGHFTYALDDPYVHLTLAKNIWHGSYAINWGEPSAPSSSILWPFLLAPFSILGKAYEYVPLVINLFCLSLLVYILSLIFSDLRTLSRNFLIFLILLSFNIYGLVFMGMEHSLQLIGVAVVLMPIVRAPFCNPKVKAPLYQLIALVLLPLIRYEDLAISLPLIYFIYAKGEKQKAIVVAAVLLVLMVCFSGFLAAMGLGLLPFSILIKLQPVATNLITNLNLYGFLVIPIVVIVVLFKKHNNPMWLVVLSASLLHFFVAYANGFGRYEIYYLLFIALIIIRLLIDYKLTIFPAIIALPLMFFNLLQNTINIPRATENILNQQAQLAEIAKSLNDKIAVNDIGLVSLRSGQYVLDLVGLGSKEAFSAWYSTESARNWIERLMQEKQIKYAFVYDPWFKDRPPSWIKIAKLTLKKRKIAPAYSIVSLYALDPASAAKLRAVLLQYEKNINKENVGLQIY